jgi:signal transduction histidine kinase
MNLEEALLKPMNEITVSEVMNAMPFYTMLVDDHHYIVQANRAVLSELGVEPGAITGKFCPEVVHGTKKPWPSCPLEEAAHLNKAVEREAFDERSGKWIRSAIYPVEQKINGRRIFFHMVTDITELKEEMARREQTEQRLMKQYDVEKKLRSKLEHQIEQRKEFTRALIHELKTPLTPILGTSEMLMDLLDDPALSRMARNINRGVVNMNNSINNLVDLTKGEIGILELASRDTDIRIMLTELYEFTAADASRRGQLMTLELPESLPRFRVDEDRLRQVILNLLDNATKFTPPGGRITISATLENNKLTIRVTDTGCGIEASDIKRLFIPYKGRRRSAGQLSGLGLGLPLSKMLVRLHHGSISIASSRGEGTTVTVQIPADCNSTKGS